MLNLLSPLSISFLSLDVFMLPVAERQGTRGILEREQGVKVQTSTKAHSA